VRAYAQQIAWLDAIPGYGVITAQDIVATIGLEMAVIPTVGHQAS
jgi:hypothetical protein